MAEDYPGLVTNMDGILTPAADFKYVIPTAAPDEEEDTRTPEEREAQGTETIRKIGGALGRAALGVGKGLLGGARAIR
jgi:hypothetical protein